MFTKPYVVFDIETRYSANDIATGWNDKAALGLSIGAWYCSIDQKIYWFDEHTLAETMQQWVKDQPLIVGFNHLQFDAPLMRGILRRRAELLPQENAQPLIVLCDAFKLLCASSYDILAEIWAVAPSNPFARGLHSLDAIAQANGLGGKTGHGAQAPHDWAAGRWAQVLNYCSNDVYLTNALFQLILSGAPLKRSNGTALLLRQPALALGPSSAAMRALGTRFADAADYHMEAL